MYNWNKDVKILGSSTFVKFHLNQFVFKQQFDNQEKLLLIYLNL